MSAVISVETPDGPGELVLDAAEAPRAVLLLGHGAGGDVDSWDLSLLAARLPAAGVSVARYRQPYRVAGRKIYSSAPGLDRGWAAALAGVREVWPGLPLFTGGRSAGARVACRGVDAFQAGLVLLAFPLHQPGRPEKSRAGELLGTSVPALVLQGTRDTFGTPDEVRAALRDRSNVRLVEVPGAGHTLGPSTSTPQREADERARLVVTAVASFIGTGPTFA